MALPQLDHLSSLLVMSARVLDRSISWELGYACQFNARLSFVNALHEIRADQLAAIFVQHIYEGIALVT